jgi:DNA-binding CsgD family transcriptional regulator/predicted enzyme related to lactoylglutathione lyase
MRSGSEEGVYHYANTPRRVVKAALARCARVKTTLSKNICALRGLDSCESNRATFVLEEQPGRVIGGREGYFRTMNRDRGRPAHDDVLTPMEWTTVEWVRHGLTNRQIAARRGVSLDAVKFHVGNVLGKLGLENRRQLRRWDGVPADSALKGRETMPATAMGPIGQVSRTVADLAVSTEFYGDALGLPHLYTFGELAFFDCGGTRLYLHQTEVRAESVLYFQVPDIHAAHRELSDKGVAFQGAPHMIHRHEDCTEEWMAFFSDPEGRTLAIMAQARSS